MRARVLPAPLGVFTLGLGLLVGACGPKEASGVEPPAPAPVEPVEPVEPVAMEPAGSASAWLDPEAGEAKAGEPKQLFQGFLPASTRVQFYTADFTPDGRYLVLGIGDEHGMVLLELEGDRYVERQADLSGHTEPIWSVAFHPTELLLASGASWPNRRSERAVRLWSIPDGKQVGEALKVDSANIDTLAWSPNGELLAAGTEAGVFVIWRVGAGGREVEALTRNDDDVQGVRALAFAPDSSSLLVGRDESWARVDLDGAVIDSGQQGATALAVMRDGGFIAGSDHCAVVRFDAGGEALWRTEVLDDHSRYLSRRNQVDVLVVDAVHGEVLVGHNERPMLRYLDLDTGAELRPTTQLPKDDVEWQFGPQHDFVQAALRTPDGVVTVLEQNGNLTRMWFP